MVISGRNTDRFEDANFATLREVKEAGQWQPASTNHEWDVFWCEVTAYDGDTVELAKFDGTHEIHEDGPGEYLLIEQDHHGLFANGTYETRFRPYIESNTETKEWMENDAE